MKAGQTVYVSGQLGMVPATGAFAEGGVVPQARQALVNMGEILKEAGGSYSDGGYRKKNLTSLVSFFSFQFFFYRQVFFFKVE